jgi:large subunit ribosomal protein L10
MITRAQKQEIIDGLVEKFQKASGVYVLNYEKMPVAQLTDFRRKLTEEGIDVQVAKNTLIVRAMNEVDGIDIPEEMLVGQSILAFGYDDPVLPAKLIKEFLSKGKTERPALKVVSIEGQIYDSTQLDVVANLPTREDMIAGIIGSLNAPISGIVGALDQATPLVRTVSAVTRDLISVIDAVAKKQNKAA